jgi:hypothetical protein
MAEADLDKLRTKASFMLPHGSLSVSPTQPIVVEAGGKFGPFEGQILMGEMNKQRIFRLMPETVHGQVQGAVTTLIDGRIGLGSNRFMFDKAGDLWVGRTSLGWPGSKGLCRVRWNRKVPTAILNMTLTPRGFRLTFTRAMNRQTLEKLTNYKGLSYTYLYRKKYGSPQVEQKKIEIKAVAVSEDGKTVDLELSELIEGRVFQLNMQNLVADDGQALAHPVLYYTLNKKL